MERSPEAADSREQEELHAFYTAAENIGEQSDLAINGLLGIATAEDQNYKVDCMFSRRFGTEDFGTVLGTLLGTHAVQHGWTPEQISGFLLRVVAKRADARSVQIVEEKTETQPEEG